MRDILASLAGTTHRFRATPIRTGNGDAGMLTLLLVDVTYWQGWYCCDHMWCPLVDALRPVCRHLGETVEFRATVVPYRRGDGSCDFGFRGYSDVRVVKR